MPKTEQKSGQKATAKQELLSQRVETLTSVDK